MPQNSKQSSQPVWVLAVLVVAVAAAPSLPAQQDVPASGVPAKTLAPPPAKSPAGKKKAPEVAAAKAGDDKPQKTAYDFNLPGPDGKDVPLSSFKGKYLVIVNLARKSTYNEQLAGLIKLNDTYKTKDVVVIGVPSNDFGAGEPGTGPEIQKAYADAKTDFPVMGLAKVSGEDQLPFYLFMTKGKTAPPGGPVHWNYTKFIIDKKGTVLARLDPDVAPDSPEMFSTLDQILDGKFKPKKAGAKPDAPAEGDDDDE